MYLPEHDPKSKLPIILLALTTVLVLATAIFALQSQSYYPRTLQNSDEPFAFAKSDAQVLLARAEEASREAEEAQRVAATSSQSQPIATRPQPQTSGTKPGAADSRVKLDKAALDQASVTSQSVAVQPPRNIDETLPVAATNPASSNLAVGSPYPVESAVSTAPAATEAVWGTVGFIGAEYRTNCEANVRAAANTSSAILGTVSYNSLAIQGGLSENGWVPVSVNGLQGFILGELLNAGATSLTPMPTNFYPDAYLPSDSVKDQDNVIIVQLDENAKTNQAIEPIETPANVFKVEGVPLP